MNTRRTIIKRVNEICREKNSSICDISLRGGMSPSVLYDLMHGRTKFPTVITIKKFCEGANITLGEFFSVEDFNELEDDLEDDA